jgi:transcription antitermination factor NusG
MDVLAEGNVDLPASVEPPWYAVRVRSNCERTAAASLDARGLECCLPLYSRRSRWSDRIRTINSPLFPGYVFCRFDRAQRSAVIAAPGVVHVVSFGGVPAPVDSVEIAAVRTICRSGIEAEPCPYLEAGQEVEIVDGPMAGLRGMVCQMKRGQRLVVNVSLLRRAVSVEVDSEWVRPLYGSGRPDGCGLHPASEADSDRRGRPEGIWQPGRNATC